MNYAAARGSSVAPGLSHRGQPAVLKPHRGKVAPNAHPSRQAPHPHALASRRAAGSGALGGRAVVDRRGMPSAQFFGQGTALDWPSTDPDDIERVNLTHARQQRGAFRRP